MTNNTIQMTSYETITHINNMKSKIKNNFNIAFESTTDLELINKFYHEDKKEYKLFVDSLQFTEPSGRRMTLKKITDILYNKINSHHRRAFQLLEELMSLWNQPHGNVEFDEGDSFPLRVYKIETNKRIQELLLKYF